MMMCLYWFTLFLTANQLFLRCVAVLGMCMFFFVTNEITFLIVAIRIMLMFFFITR